MRRELGGPLKREHLLRGLDGMGYRARQEFMWLHTIKCSLMFGAGEQAWLNDVSEFVS